MSGKKKIIRRAGKPPVVARESLSSVVEEPVRADSNERIAPIRKISPNPIGADELGIHGLIGMVVQWEGITEHTLPGDFCVAGFGNKSIHITGELGGGSFDFVGKNDPRGKEYSVLTDTDGDPLSAVSKRVIREVSSHCYCLKPVRNGGDGMNVNITMILYNKAR